MSVSKLLELNRLPEVFGKYNGILTGQSIVQVVENRLHDFTKMQTINGRRVPTVTNSYEFVRIAQPMQLIPSFDMLPRWAFSEQVEEDEFYLDGFTDERGHYHMARTLKVEANKMSTILYYLPLNTLSIVRRESIKTQSGQTPYRNTSRPNINVGQLIERMGITLEDFSERMAHVYFWNNFTDRVNNYGVEVMEKSYGYDVSLYFDKIATTDHTGKEEVYNKFIRITDEASGEQLSIKPIVNNIVNWEDYPANGVRVSIGFTFGSLDPMRQYSKEVAFKSIDGLLIRI